MVSPVDSYTFNNCQFDGDCGYFSGNISARYIDNVASAHFSVVDSAGNSFSLSNVTLSGNTLFTGSAVLTITDNANNILIITMQAWSTPDLISRFVFYENGVETAIATNPPDAHQVQCYCPGTRILTDRGEQPIEALRIGDRVATQFSGMQPVRWIGRRSYQSRFLAGGHLMLPVCIKADAIADGVPARDLFVSPGHGIYLDGGLVPAWRLINGVSVIQKEPAGEVIYLHIEFAEHEVIVAENCAAESYFDDGCRNQFQNAAEFRALYPSPAEAARTRCSARIEDGFHLQAIQQRFAARAGLILQASPCGPLHGFIDQAGPDMVSGWAQDRANPEQPVVLDILVDGQRAGRVLANSYRADLRRAGVGSGAHAFALRLPVPCTGAITVRRTQDHACLELTEEALLSIAA